MTQKTFSREGAAMWIADFESQGKGWPSVEGFLLREYLAGNLSLDNCREVREIYIEMNPYQKFPPNWKLLKRWLGKSYATKPILKNKVPLQSVEPDFDMSELIEMSQAIDRELPAWLDQMLGR